MTNKMAGVSEPHLTRTQRIVDRVQHELEEGVGKDHLPLVETRESIIRETLTMVRTYAESLNHQATQASVYRNIIMIAAAALGRLNIPYGLLNKLNDFASDINALVHSPNPAQQ